MTLTPNSTYHPSHGKIIIVIAIVRCGVRVAKGWIAEWFDTAVDTSIDSVKRTQRNATKVRPADPGAPEEKK
jgi:hypothetical protein